jgi:hypothetical protein
MTKAEKLLEKMRRNPCDWRIEDLESLAERHGLEVRKPGGSHAIFFINPQDSSFQYQRNDRLSQST